MSSNTFVNKHHQPLDFEVANWQPASCRFSKHISGEYIVIESLNPQQHLSGLYEALCVKTATSSWTYLPYGPFASIDDFEQWLFSVYNDESLFFYTLIHNGQAVGLISYLNIKPDAGSIEIGHIHFAEILKHTTAATESLYLLIHQAFNLGNRRVEWVCHYLNEPSNKAAKRLGFQYEGCLRYARVVKGRNRNTNIYSILNDEWLNLNKAYIKWLSTDNFDDSNQQKSSLFSFISK